MSLFEPPPRPATSGPLTAALLARHGLTNASLADRVERVVTGRHWVLSVVHTARGEQRAGMAMYPSPDSPDRREPLETPTGELARTCAAWLASDDRRRAAIGLATLNALIEPEEGSLSDVDGADWLASRAPGRRVAVVGRFPFVDHELRPVTQEVWVFEQEPRHGEYGPEEMATILPQAELVAISASALINHTLEGILELVAPAAEVLVLGPSTPLSPVLFDYGVDRLSGVLVQDVDRTASDVAAGVSFRHIGGLRRVTLAR